MGDQMIAPTDLSKLGMPESSLKVTHPETGKQGYRVGVEVFHHLHCINLLRRVTYKDYYEPLGGEFSHGPEALQAHTGEPCHGTNARMKANAINRPLPGSTARECPMLL